MTLVLSTSISKSLKEKLMDDLTPIGSDEFAYDTREPITKLFKEKFIGIQIEEVMYDYGGGDFEIGDFFVVINDDNYDTDDVFYENVNIPKEYQKYIRQMKNTSREYLEGLYTSPKKTRIAVLYYYNFYIKVKNDCSIAEKRKLKELFNNNNNKLNNSILSGIYNCFNGDTIQLDDDITLKFYDKLYGLDVYGGYDDGSDNGYITLHSCFLLKPIKGENKFAQMTKKDIESLCIKRIKNVMKNNNTFFETIEDIIIKLIAEADMLDCIDEIKAYRHRDLEGGCFYVVASNDDITDNYRFRNAYDSI